MRMGSFSRQIFKKIPILKWLPEYSKNWLLHDLLAGFTVALTEIPQSIAYAGIAGLPLQYGLYSSFIGGFMYAIFGSCKAVNMGSTSIMALLIQEQVQKHGVAASIFMSFFGGIVIFVFGLAKLGFIIEFFAYPVMTGFTTAAAVTIATAQLYNFLGVPAQAHSFLSTWKIVLAHLEDISKWDASLGFGCLCALLCLQKIGSLNTNKSINRHIRRALFLISISKNLIVVLIGTTLAWFLQTKNQEVFKLTGIVEEGLPSLTLPPLQQFFELCKDYGISLILIPLVAILETIAVGKVFSQGKLLDASQEMLALGIANFMGSFVRSMPVTGSFTRTAINIASGAETNMSGVFTGLTILAALQFLTGTFQFIPKATLAAIIICAMWHLLDFKASIFFWNTSKLEFFCYLVTLLSSLLLSLEYGILIGIVTSLAIMLFSVARPAYQLKRIEVASTVVYLIALPGNIYFPAIEHLKRKILSIDIENVNIILDGTLAQNMETTVAKGISSLLPDLEAKKQKLILWNFDDQTIDVCVNTDPQLISCFKSGTLENIVQNERLLSLDSNYLSIY